MYKNLILLLLVSISIQLNSQRKEVKPANWDVNNPHERLVI